MRQRVMVVTLSVCLSVADLEYDGLLAHQTDMCFKLTTIKVPLICHFFEIWPCS